MALWATQGDERRENGDSNPFDGAKWVTVPIFPGSLLEQGRPEKALARAVTAPGTGVPSRCVEGGGCHQTTL